MRLKAYRESPELAEQVRPNDRHGVLAAENLPAPKSLDEILDLDDELLTETEDDIFTFRHARPAAARPDKVSERKPCKDFDQFKPLFSSCVFRTQLRQAQKHTLRQ